MKKTLTIAAAVVLVCGSLAAAPAAEKINCRSCDLRREFAEAEFQKVIKKIKKSCLTFEDKSAFLRLAEKKLAERLAAIKADHVNHQ